MIKYKTFGYKEEDKINEFLKENEGIARDGIVFKDDTVCFLYEDNLSEQIEISKKQSILHAIEQWVSQYRNQLIQAEHGYRLANQKGLKGETNAVQNISKSSELKQDAEISYQTAKQLLEDIKKEEFEL